MITPETKPIYAIGQYEFAALVEKALLPLVGGRPQLTHNHAADGTLESYDIRFRDNIIERDNPPANPMGPHIGWAPTLIGRNSRDERKERGLKPTFTGGATSGFADLHLSFIGAAARYGALLDKEALRDSSALG